MHPLEAASGAKVIITSSNSTQGITSTVVGVKSGKYNLAVNYFD